MFVLLFPLISQTQDPVFSQFYANRLYLNPGFAGVEMDVRRAFINYRNQWPGISGNFVTYSASYDQYIDIIHGGFGVRVMNDIQGQGSINQFELGLVYAYQFAVTRDLTISAGIDATYVQRSMNTSDLILGDMIDPRTGLVSNPTSDFLFEQNVAHPDFTVGVTSFYRNIYGGFSAAHLLRPYQTVSSDQDSRLARRIIVFAGGMFPVYERRLGKEILQLSPNLIYLQQKDYSQITFGVEGLVKEQIVGGIWLRQNLGIKFGAIIFSAGYVTNNFRIRYSYDQQLSSPTVNLPVLGSHELSLILTIDGQKKKKHRAIKCPKI